MIFRQLFEPSSSTFTYLLACPDTRSAILIDPVFETIERDMALLAELNLRLAYTLETHIHADHVTGAGRLRALTGCKAAVPARSGVEGADVEVDELTPVIAGAVTVQPLYTPGHTDHHHCYAVAMGETERLFTGDCLLIDGCGRTDFQGGDARTLYASVHAKIFSRAADALIHPGHDYHGRFVSTVAQERQRNARLGGGKTVDEFVAIMAALDLPPPSQIDLAVPANLRCGMVLA